MQNIFSNFEFAVLGEIFLQIPAPTSVENPDENGPDKVNNQNRYRRENLLIKKQTC
jgi:hypothetical protein